MASWVKPVEAGRWSLYIATPLLDEKGATRAYREVYRVLRSLENPWVTDSDISLVGQDEPITRDALEIIRRYPARLPTRSRRSQLGNLAVEESYIYPPMEYQGKAPRLSFTVSYLRRGSTNEWNAKTTRSELIKGTKAKGAVGYSTTHWEGETSADVKHATVLVLLEIDPRIAISDIEDDQELLRTLTNRLI
jgi:hypothetical protein